MLCSGSWLLCKKPGWAANSTHFFTTRQQSLICIVNDNSISPLRSRNPPFTGDCVQNTVCTVTVSWLPDRTVNRAMITEVHQNPQKSTISTLQVEFKWTQTLDDAISWLDGITHDIKVWQHNSCVTQSILKSPWCNLPCRKCVHSTV